MANGAGLKRVDEGLEATLRISKDAQAAVPVKHRTGAADDFLDRLGRQAKEAKAAAAPGGPVNLEGLEADFGLKVHAGALAIETKATRLLREAREHAGAGRHAEAVRLLEELLRLERGHPEAILLLASCRLAMDEPGRAYEVLAPLAAAALTPRLATRARELMARIRVAIIPFAMSKTLELLNAGRSDEAIADLDAYRRSFPEAWEFPYMLAGSYGMLERLDEAVRAATEGLALCAPGEEGPLRDLHANLHARRTRKALEPALEAYRRGDHAKALDSIRGIDPTMRAVPLAAAFESYLKRLVGPPKKTPEKVAPTDDWAASEELHFFLAGPEVAFATALLGEDRPVEALPVIERARALTPWFPYACFLRAYAAVEALVVHAKAKKMPPLPQSIADMERALTEAEFSKRDPDLKAAPQLIKNVQGIVEALRDRVVLDPLNRDVEAIHDEIEAKIRDVAHLRKLLARTRALRARLAPAGSSLHAGGKESLRQLGELLDKMIQFLQEGEVYLAEQEGVNELYRRVNAYVPSTQWAAKSFLHGIVLEAMVGKQKATKEEVRKQYDKLISEIQGILART